MEIARIWGWGLIRRRLARCSAYNREMTTQSRKRISVGVRELHNRTSELMQAVADGAELEVTRHGMPVGVMQPVGYDALYERLKREGRIIEGKSPHERAKLPDPIKLAPGVTVSDLIKEQRR